MKDSQGLNNNGAHLSAVYFRPTGSAILDS